MNSSEEEEKLIVHKRAQNDYESIPKDSSQGIHHNEGASSDTAEYTIDDAIEHFKFGKFHIRLLFGVGMAILSDSVLLLTPAVLGSVLECGSWKLSKVQVAWITTAVFLGKAVCAPAIGYIIDKNGRRKGLLVTLTCVPIFVALGALSPSYPYLIASRFLAGAAFAGALQVNGYIEEFMSAGHRRWATLVQVFWPLGGLWTSGLGLLMIYKYGLSWKWYLLVVSAPMFITILTVYLLPESARFLGALGKFDKVEKILRNIGKENKTGLPSGSLSRVRTYGSTNNDTESSQAKFKDLLSCGNIRTTVPLVVMWLVSGFLYYGIIFLIRQLNTEKGVDTPRCNQLALSDYSYLMWTGFAELPGVFLVFFALEYLGRKKTLLIQFIVVGCSLIPFFFQLPGAASFIAILVARTSCQGSICSLIIYTPEVYPTFLRGKGIGVANMFFRTGGMLTPFFSQVTIENYFDLTISIYIGCCFVAAICAIILPKETQGTELEH